VKSPNIDAVKAVYESFGRGDVAAILARLAPGAAKSVSVRVASDTLHGELQAGAVYDRYTLHCCVDDF
jgi:hypothetical protein